MTGGIEHFFCLLYARRPSSTFFCIVAYYPCPPFVIASQLVGPNGTVIGVDMTDEQLAVARAHVDWHMQRYGYSKPNVTFLKGVIEDLLSVGIQDATVDVCVSNCVLNLSPNKPQVLSEIFRVLKPGGELYFSDVFCDRRLPAALKGDREVLGECLGGALYIGTLRGREGGRE